MGCPDPIRDPDPDFLETYERSVDRQLADEAREAEDEGSHGFLSDFLE